MSLAKLIVFNKIKKINIFWAGFIFIAQLVYYQFQNQIQLNLTDYFIINQAISFPLINNPSSILNLLQVLIHALFSIFIVDFLYRERDSTMLIFYLSLILLFTYIITNLLTKFTGIVVFDVISTTIYFFIASPFKTIFSIPMLHLKNR